MKDKTLIMIVDDDPNIAQLVKLYLEKDGYDTVAYGRGDEALAAFRQNPPSLMILDIMLPGMDGIRVLRQLRREGCASEIFLISAFVSDHMLAEATELRVDYFLPKPFAFEALFDRMRGAAPSPPWRSGRR